MSRTANGSWGILNVNITNEEDMGSLLIYDTDVNATNVGNYNFDKDESWKEYMTEMVYADSGWKKDFHR